MHIRDYKPSDCKEIAELFYNTVHSINAIDYSTEQLDVWASGKVNLQEWNDSFIEHYTLLWSKIVKRSEMVLNCHIV